VLDAEGWERARVAALLAAVREARAHVPAEDVGALAVIDRVVSWLQRGAPESERDSLRWASWAARGAEVAVWAAEWATTAARAAAAEWATATEEAAADRIAHGVLDAIEAEIDGAGGVR